MLINIETKKQISEYQFRRQHSNVIFPKELTDEILKSYNYANLKKTSIPEYDSWNYKPIESYEEKDGVWTQVWTLEPIVHTDEEIQQRLSQEKEKLIVNVDNDTSSKISTGFFCEVTPPDTNEPELLFFSYDSFDQQNFADAAIVILNSLQTRSADTLKQSWNAYRNHTDDYKGDLVVLDLTPATFLPIYQAACTHKATVMTEGSALKEKIRNASSLEELKELNLEQ